MSADVEVEVFISPFEIPRAVRGFYDEQRKRFVVDFKYITQEPTEYKDFGPSEVTTKVGSKTGRILGFEIDVDALGASSVSFRMRDVAQEVVRKAIIAAREHEAPSALDPWSRIELNSRVASRVLEDSQDKVFSRLKGEASVTSPTSPSSLGRGHPAG